MKKSVIHEKSTETKKNTNKLIPFHIYLLDLIKYGKDKKVSSCDPAKYLNNELKKLRAEIDTRMKTSSECEKLIVDSFVKSRHLLSKEKFEQLNAWPRYAKTMLYSTDTIIKELIDYVDASNYRVITKRLTDLFAAVVRENDTQMIERMNAFSETVFLHILDHISRNDVPVLLALGRNALNRKEYRDAEKWFTKVTETDDPYHGVTALLSCYETEIKELLTRDSHRSDFTARKRIKELNNRQFAVYEKWCVILGEHLQDEATSMQDKKRYVAIMTGYARFERLRGNYKKAFELLDRIPESYPEISRVFAERAMIYQFKPYSNDYYDLEKAVRLFVKADEALCKESRTEPASPKSRKSILMPLANTLFQLNQYHEASLICDNVLKIDSREQRAIDLKKRIACLA